MSGLLQSTYYWHCIVKIHEITQNMLQTRLYLLEHHTPISITLQSPFVYFLMQSTTASYCELCFLIFILYQLTFRHINLQKNALLLNPDFFMF